MARRSANRTPDLNSPAVVAFVLLVGAALLLPRLGSQSLWLDESLTIVPAVTATSVSDLVQRVRSLDTQPPASHLVLYAIGGHRRHSELFYRLPSLLAVEIGIAVLYLVVRRLWGSTVAIVVAACAQLSPYLCFYAAEARNYGLWFCLIAISALTALRYIDAARARAGARRWAWALALGVTNALGLWTHLFHLFVVLAEGVILSVVFLRRDMRGARAVAFATLAGAELVTVLLFAPWLVVLARATRAGTAGLSWTRPFTVESLAYYLFAAHFGVSFGPTLRSLHVQQVSALVAAHSAALALATAAIVVTALTYVVLVYDAAQTRERRWELLPLVAWPLCAVAGPVAYAAFENFPLHPRHLMLAWPVLPIVLGLGLVRCRRLRPLLIASLLLQLVALGNLLFDPRYAKDDERGAVRFAEDHSRAPAYVLGDVAALYATSVAGEPKGFLDFGAETHDVWLVDNRTWEEPNHRARARLARKMHAMGMRYEGGTARFGGIVLRHWTTPDS